MIEPQREQEKGCCYKAARNKNQKMTLSKLEQSLKKEENKTSISPKSQDNVKAEYSGNSPSKPGVSLQFLTWQHRSMISYVALKWEIPQMEATPTGRPRPFPSPSASTWGWQLLLHSDWLSFVWRGKKWEPKVCSKQTVCSQKCERQWHSCQVRG